MGNNKKTIINKDWDKIYFKNQEENNFSNFAFPLYLFTKRLYEELQKKGTKDVLFMSREGQFLKKLFDYYVEQKKVLNNIPCKIKTHYFYGSRNSVMTASSKSIKEEDFEYLFRFFGFMLSPKMFMFSIGFTETQIEKVRQTFGKKTDKICFNFKSSKTLEKLKQNKEFLKIYEENRKEQSKAFGEYMKTFDVVDNKNLTFVDIGYHGTMQDLIFKFFDQKTRLTGYFIKNRSENTKDNEKFGLLGDSNNKKLFGSNVTKYDSFNYEQILRADHGRCQGYITTKDGSGPIIETEYKSAEIFEKFVKKLQDMIFEKFQMIVKKDLTEQTDIEKICVIYNYYLIKNKTKADYKWLIDMQDCHHDDFGFVGYPGKMFARWLRKLTFKTKDKIFVLKNKHFINKLRKSLI